jgi:hypothetical protein
MMPLGAELANVFRVTVNVVGKSQIEALPAEERPTYKREVDETFRQRIAPLLSEKTRKYSNGGWNKVEQDWSALEARHLELSVPAFEVIVDILNKSEKEALSVEKRQAYRCEVAEIIRQYIQALLEKTRQYSNMEWNKVEQDWSALRAQIVALEREERRLDLSAPASPEAFQATLFWMGEQGEEQDLAALRAIERQPPFVSEEILRTLKNAQEDIDKRVYRPTYVLRQGEAAYAAHKQEWEQQYWGQHIAIHAGEIIEHDTDKNHLEEKLIKKQLEEGRFRAHVIHVGAPVLRVRDPRVGRPKRVPPKEK